MPEQRHKGSGTLREVRAGVDGATSINESTFVADEQVLDHYGPLAVQIPENSGADGSFISMGLADALEEGHVEGKFGTTAAPVPVHPDPDAVDEKRRDAVRAAGEDKGDDFEPDHDTVVGPEYHKQPAVIRVANAEGEGEVSEEDVAEAEDTQSEVDDADADRMANAATADDSNPERR